MDDTVLKIAMAAFFHDIGKMADKEIMGVSTQYFDNNASIYLPVWNGRYSHSHAVYTAAFIEQMKDFLPKECNEPGWGEGDSFINLAAGHHNPDTPMQWMIAIADRISSGFDRAQFEEAYNKAVAPRDYQKNRLLPIFEHLSPEAAKDPETSEDYQYCYPLREITPANIFPALKKDVVPRDQTVASREYQELYDGLVEGLKGLYHREQNKMLWFEHAESLIMLYASSVPAARAGHVIPDVSLYDHLKTTSAIAAALYLYHNQTGTLSVSDIKNDKTKKFLMVSGDFYGIQNFIFSSAETQEKRSKMLRGRSFAVSLFSELAADMICRKIGLPSVSVILNAAGKFTLIAPSTPATLQAIADTEKTINEWLISASYGETTMGISFVAAAANDFVKSRFSGLWESLKQRMDIKKYHKFDLLQSGGVVKGYLDSFNNDLKNPICPFCGKRPSHSDVEGSRFTGDKVSACLLCRDHIFLGENLVKNDLVAITTTDAEIKGKDSKLQRPIFDEYQVAFLDGGLNDMAKKGKLLKYWDVSNPANGRFNKNVTARFINGYVPVYHPADLEDERLLWGKKDQDKKLEQWDEIVDKAPKTFAHIANKSLILKDGKYAGVEALGVLKADVDNLGLLMSCGLKGDRFTLSRLATLSRQLNYYFSVYLPHLLMNRTDYNDVYTVFAGGDDLFLICPWNRMITLAQDIRNSFADYVCHNPEIHLSAGISLQKPNRPVGFMAESSESDLEAAKDGGRDRLTVFSETVLWDEMTKLTLIGNEMETWLERKWVNPAMLYRLNHIMKMAGDENRLVKNHEIHLEDMECTKWRALLSYSVGRNAGKDLKADERPAVVEHVMKSLTQWLMDYGSKLKIPVWNILYNRRTMKL